MNIQCGWGAMGELTITRGDIQIGYVSDESGEPVLVMIQHVGVYGALSFSEIEHVMDNFYNMPKK
jgi:hypothetical protein